jgi:hypothetical protein
MLEIQREGYAVNTQQWKEQNASHGSTVCLRRLITLEVSTGTIPD